MSFEQEDFEQLRRLLSLKRHEQPPPGYFDGFSRQVVLRIKSGERGEELESFSKLWSGTPWLQRVLSAFSTNPALAGAFGLAMCSLLVAGVAYSNTPGGATIQDVVDGTAPDPDLNLQLANQSSGFISSTNGLMPTQASGSLFDEIHPRLQPTLVNTVGPAQ